VQKGTTAKNSDNTEKKKKKKKKRYRIKPLSRRGGGRRGVRRALLEQKGRMQKSNNFLVP